MVFLPDEAWARELPSEIRIMASRQFSSLLLRAAVLPISRRAVVNLPVSRLQHLQEWNFGSFKLSKISVLFTE